MLKINNNSDMPDAVSYNGNQVKKINFNGRTVWEEQEYFEATVLEAGTLTVSAAIENDRYPLIVKQRGSTKAEGTLASMYWTYVPDKVVFNVQPGDKIKIYVDPRTSWSECRWHNGGSAGYSSTGDKPLFSGAKVSLDKMPSLSNFVATNTKGTYIYAGFFHGFNYGGSIAHIADGLFEIPEEVDYLQQGTFAYFNCDSPLDALPAGSFRTDNIKKAYNPESSSYPCAFFQFCVYSKNYMNSGGPTVTSFPAGAFHFDNLEAGHISYVFGGKDNVEYPTKIPFDGVEPGAFEFPKLVDSKCFMSHMFKNCAFRTPVASTFGRHPLLTEAWFFLDSLFMYSTGAELGDEIQDTSKMTAIKDNFLYKFAYHSDNTNFVIPSFESMPETFTVGRYFMCMYLSGSDMPFPADTLDLSNITKCGNCFLEGFMGSNKSNSVLPRVVLTGIETIGSRFLANCFYGCKIAGIRGDSFVFSNLTSLSDASEPFCYFLHNVDGLEHLPDNFLVFPVLESIGREGNRIYDFFELALKWGGVSSDDTSFPVRGIKTIGNNVMYFPVLKEWHGAFGHFSNMFDKNYSQNWVTDYSGIESVGENSFYFPELEIISGDVRGLPVALNGLHEKPSTFFALPKLKTIGGSLTVYLGSSSARPYPAAVNLPDGFWNFNSVESIGGNVLLYGVNSRYNGHISPYAGLNDDLLELRNLKYVGGSIMYKKSGSSNNDLPDWLDHLPPKMFSWRKLLNYRDSRPTEDTDFSGINEYGKLEKSEKYFNANMVNTSYGPVTVKYYDPETNTIYEEQVQSGSAIMYKTVPEQLLITVDIDESIIDENWDYDIYIKQTKNHSSYQLETLMTITPEDVRTQNHFEYLVEDWDKGQSYFIEIRKPRSEDSTNIYPAGALYSGDMKVSNDVSSSSTSTHWFHEYKVGYADWRNANKGIVDNKLEMRFTRIAS